MGKFLIDGSTLTSIAKAIRGKNSAAGDMTPLDMPGYINSITTGSTQAADYVVKEVDRVVEQVVKLNQGNTLTFLATSDIHYGTGLTNMNFMVADLGPAVDLLRKKIAFDFEADLGDKIFGNTKNASEDVNAELIFINNVLGYSSSRIGCLGNHDTYKTSKIQRYGATYYLNHGVTYGDELGGYCYRDFPEKKVRIFVLNTSESNDNSYSGSSHVTSSSQLKWLCEQLMAMDGLTDYQVLFMSHLPPDNAFHNGTRTELYKILKAFEKRSSYSIDGATYNFSTIARPIIIGWCHGHLHNHITRTVGDLETTRFCIPSALKNRANEYSNQNKDNASYMEYFGESYSDFNPNSYTMNSPTSTALSVIVVNLETKKVDIVNYGALGQAGNREFVYGSSDTVTIENILTFVKNTNPSTVAIIGSEYSTSIEPIDSNYIVDSISMTMGGISANEYISGNNIYIPKVTGKIVITAIGKAKTVYNVNNLLYAGQSVTSDVAGSYGTNGYIEDRRVSEDDNSSKDGTYTNTLTDFVTTGWIPYEPKANNESTAIYVRGGQFFLDNDGSSNSKYSRIYCWPESKVPISSDSGARAVGSGESANLMTKLYTISRPEGENVYYYKFVPKFSPGRTNNFKYVRLSFKKAPNEDIYITIGEPIVQSQGEVTSYNVTNNLTHVNTTNTSTVIGTNEQYTATLSPETEEYKIDYVQVLMNESDVTDDVYDPTTRQITINPPITGNIKITAIASVPAQVPYINQLSNAESYNAGAGTYGKDYDGDGALDGYYTGVRLSEDYTSDGAGANTGTSKSSGTDKFATGWIPYSCVADEDHAIYIKNAKIDTSDKYCRIYLYYNKTKAPVGESTPSYASGTGIETHYTITRIKEDATNGEYYYKLVPKKNYDNGKYIRFSLKSTNKAPIITFGEPIE